MYAVTSAWCDARVPARPPTRARRVTRDAPLTRARRAAGRAAACPRDTQEYFYSDHRGTDVARRYGAQEQGIAQWQSQQYVRNACTNEPCVSGGVCSRHARCARPSRSC